MPWFKATITIMFEASDLYEAQGDAEEIAFRHDGGYVEDVSETESPIDGED